MQFASNPPYALTRTSFPRSAGANAYWIEKIDVRAQHLDNVVAAGERLLCDPAADAAVRPTSAMRINRAPGFQRLFVDQGMSTKGTPPSGVCPLTRDSAVPHSGTYARVSPAEHDYLTPK